MPVIRSKASRRIAATVVASAAVMLAAACGGGSQSDTSTTGGNNANGGGGNAAFTAYTDCLKKNGVTLTLPSGRPGGRPSGGPGGEGRPFPSGGPGPLPSGSAGERRFPGGGELFRKPAGVDDATWQKAQSACASVMPSFGARGGGQNGANQAYFNCLRDHGVQMGQGQPPSSTDPAVKKAREACKVLEATPAPSATS